MNKEINQLINQLHLDPKREAAFRKIVENAGGSNNSTPAGTKEVYSIKTSEFKTPEDFNNLQAAVDAGNIIIIDGSIIRSVGKGSSGGKPIIRAGTDLILHTYSGNEHENNIVVLTIIFESNGTYTTTYNQISLKSGYDGTKFLSDDGTYKEVSGGGGPVIIEVPFEGNETVTLTDEQIEAFKNSNVKLKIVYAGIVVICIPFAYAITDYSGSLCIRVQVNEVFEDLAFNIDITNKTITKQ